MSEEQYERYVKMLISCNFIVDAVNQALKANSMDIEIGNCSLESKGKYSKFVFETKNLPEGKTIMDVLGERFGDRS